MARRPERALTIGRLARAARVNVETIRYYQRRGLLGTPRKPAGGVRHYPDEALARLRFIKRAQQLGFSLRDIGELLALGEQSCAQTRDLAERRLADIEARLLDLANMRRTLKRLIRSCQAGEKTGCPIVRTLSGAHND